MHSRYDSQPSTYRSSESQQPSHHRMEWRLEPTLEEQEEEANASHGAEAATQVVTAACASSPATADAPPASLEAAVNGLITDNSSPSERESFTSSVSTRRDRRRSRSLSGSVVIEGSPRAQLPANKAGKSEKSERAPGISADKAPEKAADAKDTTDSARAEQGSASRTPAPKAAPKKVQGEPQSVKSDREQAPKSERGTLSSKAGPSMAEASKAEAPEAAQDSDVNNESMWNAIRESVLSKDKPKLKKNKDKADSKEKGSKAVEEKQEVKKYKSMKALALQEQAKQAHENAMRAKAEAEAKAKADALAAIEEAERETRQALEAARIKAKREAEAKEANAAAISEAVKLIVSPRAHRRWKGREEHEQKLRSCHSFRMAMEIEGGVATERPLSPQSTHRSQFTHRPLSATSPPPRTPVSPSPFRSPVVSGKGLTVTRVAAAGSRRQQASERLPVSPRKGASKKPRDIPGLLHHSSSTVAISLPLPTAGLPMSRDDCISAPDTPASKDTQLPSKGSVVRHATLSVDPTPATLAPMAEVLLPASAPPTLLCGAAQNAAATRLQAMQRGRTVRVRGAAAAGASSLCGQGNSSRRAASLASLRSCGTYDGSLATSQSGAGKTSAAIASARRPAGSARSARTATSARTALTADSARSSASARRQVPPQQGWVTLAMGEVQYVARRVARLPAAVKQQHIDHWSRRGALDSARERERARWREEDMEGDRWRDTPYFTQEAPSHRRCTTRPVYLQELDADPRGIGFAYGGLRPGRLHAHGRLVELHQAHFSVGVAGTYELHVALRHDRDSTIVSTPLPGSPFTLTVLPGAAHPLSTEMPPLEPALLGEVEPSDDVELAALLQLKYEPMKGCTLLLPSRDKMGNLCTSGGANVTCGVVEGSYSVAEDAEEEPTDKDPDVHARSIDLGDGTYSLRWWAFAACKCEVWVKIDGLHVLGSPAPVHFSHSKPATARDTSSSPPLSPHRSRPPVRPVAGSPRFGLRSPPRYRSPGREKRRDGNGDDAAGALGDSDPCRAKAATSLQAVQRGRRVRARAARAEDWPWAGAGGGALAAGEAPSAELAPAPAVRAGRSSGAPPLQRQGSEKRQQTGSFKQSQRPPTIAEDSGGEDVTR